MLLNSILHSRIIFNEQVKDYLTRICVINSIIKLQLKVPFYFYRNGGGELWLHCTKKTCHSMIEIVKELATTIQLIKTLSFLNLLSNKWSKTHAAKCTMIYLAFVHWYERQLSNFWFGRFPEFLSTIKTEFPFL